MKDSDESIYIAALKEGSYEAFTAIYNLYADRLYCFSMSRTRNKEMALDVVQETFLRLWETRKTLNEEGNVCALLFTIGRNLIIDMFRKQAGKLEFREYLECYEKKRLSGILSPEELLYYHELVGRVKKAKSRLSYREREIFEMSREKDLSVKRIAELLNLSQQTVKNYITSALKVFRNELK